MLNEKKVLPKIRQEVKVKVDIVTSDDIKIYYTRKFQDFTARYIIKQLCHIILKFIRRYISYSPYKSEWTSRHTYTHMKAHTLKYRNSCYNDVSLTTRGLDKKVLEKRKCW